MMLFLTKILTIHPLPNSSKFITIWYLCFSNIQFLAVFLVLDLDLGCTELKNDDATVTVICRKKFNQTFLLSLHAVSHTFSVYYKIIIFRSCVTSSSTFFLQTSRTFWAFV